MQSRVMDTKWAGFEGLCKSVLMLLVVGAWVAAGAQPLLPYDPDDKARPENTARASDVREATVRVSLEKSKPLLTIAPQFYGLNIHAGTAKFELANRDVLRVLSPDAVRIMTNHRVDWSLEGRGRTSYPLSPKQGVFDWGPLDELVDGALAIGAVPYLTIGFGPPDWLKSENSTKRMPPVRSRLDEYASFMAQIAERYHKRVVPGGLRISVENEPENVGFLLEDYSELFNRAYKKIKSVDSSIQVGGPSIGYAMWPQQAGRSLSFSQSVGLLRPRIQPDFFDWHIYSYTSKNILKTVDLVKASYGSKMPLVISELNRDWRYSGPQLAKSVEANTGWESVAWFADTYDKLQRAGVSQAFYFAWRSNALGLVDNRFKVIRPSFYIYWALTNIMGRERVQCDTGTPELGCIATSDKGGVRTLIYNSSKNDVAIAFSQKPSAELVRFDRSWYEDNRRIGAKLAVPGRSKTVALVVPRGGFVIYGH